MLDQRNLLAALLRREPALFLRFAFREIGGDGDYLHGWHIDAILHELERVRRGEVRRLIITLPPRHLKSVIVSTAWPAWLLGHNPAMRIIAASYGQELAEKIARDSLRVMDTHWYQAAFPSLHFTRRTVGDMETTQGGGRLSTSLGGPLTGRGADLIIIDDPLKAAEAMSESARNAAIEWLLNALMSRLNDQKTGAIVLVMQRLHQGDLAGELLERGGWQELRLPAIAPDDVVVPIGGGRVYLRPEGEVLHPTRQSRPTLEEIRREIGEIPFEAQYQQQPLPAKGNVVKAEWLRTYEGEPDRSLGQIVQSWDTAAKNGERNDWSVCITALVARRKCWILDVWRERVDFAQLWKAVQRLAIRYEARSLLIEDTGNGTALIQRLRNDEPRGVPSPIARHPKLDKRSRLDAASSMIEAGDLLLPREAHWLGTFKAELLGFPSTRHDDQVDALSQLMNWVDRRGNAPTRICGPIIVYADD